MMFMRIRESICSMLLAAVLVACSGTIAFGAEPSREFRLDCEALTRSPHRLAGTPEGAAAAEYIAKRLTEAGVKSVVVQPFSAVQTEVKRCEVTVEGRKDVLQLEPVRPNGIIPPVTPEGGLSGKLVVIGNGSNEDFSSRDVDGAIVVMDYNSADGWLRAFRFGAQAVIFVRRSQCDAAMFHYVEACVNLPRFYYAGDPADLADGMQAVIYSETTWKPVTARNVIGFVPGTQPVFSQGKDEVIILSVPFDSFGEIPRLSPGARQAANAAALLKLARYFAQYPSRRHVILAFLDNEARQHAGASAFYRALETDKKKWPDVVVEGRAASWTREHTFTEAMARQLTLADPLAGDSVVRRPLLSQMVNKAAEHVYKTKKEMFRLREEDLALRKKKPLAAEDTTRSREISEQINNVLTPDMDDWNAVRRLLDKLGRLRTRDLTDIPPEGVKVRLQTLYREIGADVGLRMEELAREKAGLDADTKLVELAGGKWISLHASLVLGDRTPRWAVIAGGESDIRSWDDNPGLYGKVKGVFLRAYQSVPDKERGDLGFAVESVDQRIASSRILWGAPALVYGGEVAGVYGIYNVALATCQENLTREGTPDDVLPALDLARIEQQTDAIGRLLSAVSILDETSDMGTAPLIAKKDTEAEGRDTGEDRGAVADQQGLSLRRGIVAKHCYVSRKFEKDTVKGPQVMGVMQGSSIANTPIPGAVIQFRMSNIYKLSYHIIKPYAFDKFQVMMSDMNGSYEFGPIREGDWNWRYGGVAAIFDKRGMVTSISDSTSMRQVRYRLNVFECNSGYAVLPPQLFPNKMGGDDVLVLSSRSGAVIDERKRFVELGDGIVSWYVSEREKGIKYFGLRQVVGINNGMESDHSSVLAGKLAGEGFPLTGAWSNQVTTIRSASDLWRLNDARIEVLRRKDILDSSLAELHGRSEDLLSASEAETKSPLRKMALAASSFWASRPAYQKAMGMLNDIVFAVLILLGLSVPFAFALERVLIGAVTVYRQISWFAAFFVITFMILYFSHPAFAVANTPIIIFLGFAIVVMSVLVISIIMRKFEVELKTMQGMTGTVHAADVSRLGTFVAAMQMGISTMRRRPLRTALTAITIILLTFTILCFASFSTKSGIVTLLKGPRPSYSGVFVHDVDWRLISRDVMDVFCGRWGGSSAICERLWLSPRKMTDPDLALSREDGRTTVSIRGVLGLVPDEVKLRPDLGRVLGEQLPDDIVLITQPVARMLDVKEGDKVLINGLGLTVGRLLDSVRLMDLSDMDGSSILPVDFVEQTSAQQTEVKEEDMMSARRSWTTISADSVVVVSARTSVRLGAQIQAVTLYVKDDAAAVRMAEDMARMLPMPIAATRPEGVFLHVLGTVLAASGVKDLFFPILLGGLVIFGTMLGSVSDREREIYTFSALGLAPRHVATLFLAESIVYSLIGGLGGYLLAQSVLKVLSVLAEYGLVRVPEMNMSSTNTIITILIVMLTVLISAIYPAIKASRSANPGLMRSWKPPLPKGNIMDMVFPFTVSEYDITGVVSFLKEHFDNHSDTGLGRFMALDTRMVKDKDGMMGLESRLALAPFDLGVSEEFRLFSAASEIPGIDVVRIRIERISGQPGDWQRLTKVFLDDLRQQFLLWRSLPQETMEIYRDRTLASLGMGTKTE